MPIRPRAAWVLVPAALLAALAGPLLAYYTGRGAPSVNNTHVVLAYSSELVPDTGGIYRHDVTAADSGDLAALASTTVPTISTAGRQQLSVSAICNIATAVVTVVPAYRSQDSTGNYFWTIGADVTLTAQSTYTLNGSYCTPKVYIDTDGHAAMRILVKTLSTSAEADELFVRVN